MDTIERLKQQITALQYPDFMQIWEHCAQERPTREAMEQTAPIVQQGCIRELRLLDPSFDPTNGGNITAWAQPENWAKAYVQLDQVTHQGKTWTSMFVGPNLWEPGTPGTEQLWVETVEEEGDGGEV